MKPRMLLYNFAAFFCVVILLVRNVHSGGINTKREELDQRITTLYQTVEFMARRPQQLNLDAVFGLTMAEAHVKRTLDHENMRFFDQSLINTLSEVLDFCKEVRSKAMDMINAKSNGSTILNRVVNRPDIWSQPINWSSGLLGERPSPSKHNTEDKVRNNLYKGIPNEAESDLCLTQLAEDSAKSFCRVSDQCEDMLLKNDQPRGYPLTHRLLYTQVAIALKCKEGVNTPFEKLIPAYCTVILQDAVDMEDAGLPAVSRDMICEQVLLCGMQGYTEFANDHYAKLIISWPNSAGCFSAFGFPEENRLRRLKRESEMMDYGCDNHATSLAAASLSLLIRHFVETFGVVEDK